MQDIAISPRVKQSCMSLRVVQLLERAALCVYIHGSSPILQQHLVCV